MNNLLEIIKRFHYFLIFFSLEILILFWAIAADPRKAEIWNNISGNITGYFAQYVHEFTSYVDLKNKYDNLLQSYNYHLNNSKFSTMKVDNGTKKIQDTVEDGLSDSIGYIQVYEFIPCRVINNSIGKDNNLILLNKGRNHNIEEDMGVISPDGIVGIVTQVSDNFSVVISILSKKLGVSAKIKKNGYYGSLKWEGNDYRYMKLKEIPSHLDLRIGDSIVTSGYSMVFPEGIYLGNIQKFQKDKSGNFYDIDIRLSNNFKNLDLVMVVRFDLKNDLRKLQTEIP